jgi:hypothetical protein
MSGWKTATRSGQTAPPFQQLDFLYTPSRDVAADLAYLVEVVGARVVFAIEAMGPGPCCSFRTPGGHRIAVYQLTRPEATAHFDGRRDF